MASAANSTLTQIVTLHAPAAGVVHRHSGACYDIRNAHAGDPGQDPHMRYVCNLNLTFGNPVPAGFSLSGLDNLRYGTITPAGQGRSAYAILYREVKVIYPSGLELPRYEHFCLVIISEVGHKVVQDDMLRFPVLPVHTPRFHGFGVPPARHYSALCIIP
jgi:hypothetical protein